MKARAFLPKTTVCWMISKAAIGAGAASDHKAYEVDIQSCQNLNLKLN